MKKTGKGIAIILLLIVAIKVPFGIAESSPENSDKNTENLKKTEEKNEKGPTEEIVSSQYSILINGKEIHYTATAGTIVLKKKKDQEPKASMFFIAYTKENEENKSSRPITFSFNGGPGSSSVWLHLGVLGPKRVLLNDDGTPLPPPYKLIENEYSLLDITDLVFIDPVSTGYSRAAPKENPKQFHGVQKDVKSVGEFIRLYTTKNRRWSSPKFLIGESYGTTRAAGLAGHLQDGLGMYLNGIMLVSSVLDFQTIQFNRGNDLPYILFLPTYTATAWYHNQLNSDLQKDDLQKILAEVEKFALEEYSLALLKGSALSEDVHNAVVEKLVKYTGISRDYIEQSNLKINIFRFAKELLRKQRRTIGRFDSRFLGIDRDAAGESFEFDPSYAAIQGPITATLNDYIRNELKYETDLNYEIISGDVHPWSYDKFKNRYLNFTDTLRQAMTKNPNLNVFVASGYYDLATPYFATDYSFNHLQLDKNLRKNIRIEYYEAGHMMYFHKPSLAKLKSDLEEFIHFALGQ